MPSWLPGVLVGLVAIGAPFYRGFVPDVEVQKRHLKKLGLAAWVVFDLACVLATALSAWRQAQYSGPITTRFVVSTAVGVCCVAVTSIMVAWRWWVFWMARIQAVRNKGAQLQMQTIDIHLKLIQGLRADLQTATEAIGIMISDTNLSADARRRLKELGEQRSRRE